MTHDADLETLTQDMLQLYYDHRYAEALDLVEANAGRFPEDAARIALWRACLLSVGDRSAEALTVLREALEGGLWWHESQFLDTDLDSIRERPEFKALVARSQRQYEQAVEQEIFADRAALLPEAPEPWPLLIALHGRNGNKHAHLEPWEVARRSGWLVLSPQSTQPLFPGGYCWDNAEAGLKDILFHAREILQEHRVDRERILLAGFSQGSGMAILTALSGEIPVRGVIGVGTWWEDVNTIARRAASHPKLRGYFITGAKDNTVERSHEIQAALRQNGIRCEEEIHPKMGHAFPSDFGRSFKNAVKFLLV